MDVTLGQDLEAKLARMADQQGRPAASLVEEAVQRLVHCDEWFLGEVEKGVNAADRGELIDHDEVRELINRRYPGSRFVGRTLPLRT